MKSLVHYVPKGLSRASHRQIQRIGAHSPTILVATGIVGFGATAVMAARATRRLDDKLDAHTKARNEIELMTFTGKTARSQAIVRTYTVTGYELTKLYGPTIVVGTLSTVSVLAGHRILQRRHLATVAAYSGLLEQFGSYRKRVAQTLGETAEEDIYRGARGEYQEDPDHPGEYKMKPVWDELPPSYLTPWFSRETSGSWRPDPIRNFTFLKAAQSHANVLLELRGWLSLNDVYDELGLTRTAAGQVAGWRYKRDSGNDGFIDFGFMSGRDPQTEAFRKHQVADVQLCFNIDGEIVNKIDA